ncbi:MAG: hypothetical protein ACFFDI_12505 [Promethearchaeota archaeon]
MSQQVDPKADVIIINQSDTNFINQAVKKFKNQLQSLFPAKITYDDIEKFQLEPNERAIARFLWALSHMPLNELKADSTRRKSLIERYDIDPSQLNLLLELIESDRINLFISNSKNDARVIRDHISENFFRQVVSELIDNSIAGQINLQLKDRKAISESYMIAEGVIERIVDFSSAFIREYRSMKHDLDELAHILINELGLGQEKAHILTTELKRINFYFSQELKDIHRWIKLMEATNINIFATRKFRVTGSFRWGQKDKRVFNFTIDLPKHKDFVSISVGLNLGSQKLNLLEPKHVILVKELINKISQLDVAIKLEDEANDQIISRLLFSSRLFLSGLNYESIYRAITTLNEGISEAIRFLDRNKEQNAQPTINNTAPSNSNTPPE